MKTDLVFTAFNRPEYLQQTINSWNNVRNLKEWNTTFFIEPSDKQEIIGDLAMALDTNVTTRVNETVLGVLTNPWNAINTAFTNDADFVVIAEDDVIVSQDILEYFQWTALEYQTSYKTLCINAFSDLGSGKANQLISVGHFSPLIWGIWRDRWEEHLRDTWDFDYSTGLPDGSQAGWDWNINRIITANDLRVIKPVQSRSNHIGLFGTHMTPDLMQTSQGADFAEIRGRQRYTEI
jgi:hypothetical protein